MGSGSSKKIKPINEEERKKRDGSPDGNASEFKEFDEVAQSKQILNLGSKHIVITINRPCPGSL